MATTPHIVDTYPANGAKGIPIGDKVRVIFDQEMDLDTINSGTFVLVGPDDAPVFGPIDVTPFDEPGFDDEDILSSPYFSGYVKGTISYSKVDASGGIVDDSIVDISGSGDMWQTVAIFTPDKPLKPNVEYKIMLLGDETPDDDFNTGIKTRTVFDTVFTGTGTGRLTFNGGYREDEERSYTVEITSGGATGDAEYIWWNDNDPLITYSGVTSTGARELEDGIYISCDPDGSFTIGDVFTVVIIPALVLQNNFQWMFYTGSGSIAIPPSSSSISGIVDIEDGSLLKVVSITPKDQSTNLDPASVSEVVITFNKELDSATITDDTITIWSEPVNGDVNSNIEYTGIIAKILHIDGDTITIQIS